MYMNGGEKDFIIYNVKKAYSYRSIIVIDNRYSIDNRYGHVITAG
jgi:hypothetical protein